MKPLTKEQLKRLDLLVKSFSEKQLQDIVRDFIKNHPEIYREIYKELPSNTR